jgi:type IV secretory pathway ATPase VirB11/archaellum biosynthesis ATPase
MVTIELRINERELEAELTAGLRVIVREKGVAEVAYSLSDAFAALLPHGPDYVLRATVDDAIRALLRKPAEPN